MFEGDWNRYMDRIMSLDIDRYNLSMSVTKLSCQFVIFGIIKEGIETF